MINALISKTKQKIIDSKFVLFIISHFLVSVLRHLCYFVPRAWCFLNGNSISRSYPGIFAGSVIPCSRLRLAHFDDCCRSWCFCNMQSTPGDNCQRYSSELFEKFSHFFLPKSIFYCRILPPKDLFVFNSITSFFYFVKGCLVKFVNRVYLIKGFLYYMHKKFSNSF